MAASPTDGMYLFYSIPLGLANLIQRIIGNNQNNPNTPQLTTNTANRQWFSQPRPGSDPTTEVLTVNFQLPLSVSEVGWDALRVGTSTEVWYLDRQNNWRQVLDEARVPVVLTLSASSATSWYTAHYYCYPFVAKAVQFRFTRIYDSVVGNAPYVCGMRNGLIRRNIYTRADGTQGIEPQQDPLGNTFTSYIKDWDAGKAFDNDPNTYWKCMPMPDPSAVVSMYLDCRTPGGGSQMMDTIYIDPVYTGQSLNVYYSNDDNTGTLKLSPISAVPTTDENTSWTQGKGRWDSSDPSTGVSSYQAPMAWGPLVSQDTWIGIEWTPDFDAGAGSAQNPILFQVTGAPATGQYWPVIYYDVGAGAIKLELTNGTTTQVYSAPLSPILTKNKPYRIVVGWGYSPKHVFISVKLQDGTEVANFSADESTLPTQMTLDGSIGFQDFRGLFTAHVIKLENWSVGQTSFQSNPQVYVSPDPVIPDASGTVPSTTLDQAIYAAAWVMQEFGTGGDHESRYDQKVWSPIWQNYFTQKGKLYLGTQINAKYLKLEFTNLSEESYPVYDSGISVNYKIFPVSVTNTTTTKHPGLLGIAAGLLTVGADVILGSIGSVNFLNPATINAAVNSVFGPVSSPAMVTAGQGAIITSLPNTSSLDLTDQTRSEVSSPSVYKRSPTNAQTLAAQQMTVALGGGANPAQGLSSSINTISDAVQDAMSPTENWLSSGTTAGLPTQGSDWWIFPGATLKMPASIMNGLTAISETIFGRPNTTVRNRFVTTSVHRYDIKTANRDAAVAYFAGIREVQPYITTYIASQDPPKFSFDSYDPSQFVLTNTKALDAGPLTTAGSLYVIDNYQFDKDINNWTQVQGVWTWDGTQGHYEWGSATVTANGTTKEMLSESMDAAPGAHILLSAWSKWSGLTAANSTTPVAIGLFYYDANGNFVSSDSSGISYSDWSTHGSDDWTLISHTFTVPSNVATMKIALLVNASATSGQVWFDTVEPGTTDSVEGTVFKDFITTSTFSKVRCNFTDSGVVRSDDMWAREDPNDLNINNTTLAYYTSTIPDVIPAGMWSDNFADWSSDDFTWGDPRAVVAINVDPDRMYDNKRVLHFTRAGGAEEAGVKVRQTTNFTSNGLFRIGAVFNKPNANTNQVTIRLRRMSDGVYIHEESFDPVVGYWYEFVSDFVEIPDSNDQEYTVELVLTGDAPDEFYLNDLYCEIANIRYFVRLGDSSQFLHDVTELRYADSAIVSCTDPVNEFSVQAAILSPKAYAYGCELIPVYLK